MSRSRNTFARLMCGAAVLALAGFAGAANAADYDIAPQPLAMALKEFGMKTGQPVLYGPSLADTKMSSPVVHAPDAETALMAMLDGTGLTYRRNGDTFLIVSASDPQSGSAAGDGADGTVAALIVTAQKREENIQDVPIAISAFTERSLEEQKIEGGFDLLKAIPNVTFSKNNFSGFNFSIRGVGTKAISATTDQGVAVSFNNTTLIHNRLFEQEYFDVERVEVLRGPQGTLYGRNATSGVINVITRKPNLSEFSGSIKGEVGNYHTKRLSGFVNVPLLEDVLAVRLAGSMTDRQGYDFNTTTGNAVNGRDLWSGRLTVAFNPTENIRTNLVWERFREDDNRSRTGKQLCTKDPGRTQFGALDVNHLTTGILGVVDIPGSKSYFQQGCLPGNLYDDAAFGVVSGYGLSFVQAALTLRTGGAGLGQLSEPAYGLNAGELVTALIPHDPYAGVTQSKNLREISSVRDPIYRASADVLQLNMEIDVTPSLTVFSQTLYDDDDVYSSQDYARYNSAPAFIDTHLLRPNNGAPNGWRDLSPGGVFCDPQFGCSDRIAIFDISQAKSEQFSQEIRLQSDFEGPLNFSAGANYTRFKTLNDYYVLSNVLTALSYSLPFYNANNMSLDRNVCPTSNWGFGGAVPMDNPGSSCVYVDPNPLESINGEGHNYFRSKNPYKLKSWAAFGEAYWNISDALKLTAGLRYTDDQKTFIPVPSQTLLTTGLLGSGTVAKGYPEGPAIVQKWGEYTGRLGLDWKPDLSFTDETLLYAFYSRGYKGGGANPPTIGFASGEEQLAAAKAAGVSDFIIDVLWPIFGYSLPTLQLFAVEYGSTFKPEFVNAYEVGTKNTLFDGAMTLNATGFYYDYKDYQVSQIRDRTAVNENFDAKIWGLEFESAITPTPNLRINASLGYLDTQIADGETSIDIMNRTQGNLNYAVVKPWVQLPSNCVLPVSVIANWNPGGTPPYLLCPGVHHTAVLTMAPLIDPATNAKFSYDNYPELNGGAGLLADLGGNELPNAPHWTITVGAQYSWDILSGNWRATVRGDAYWQSQSWARIYNLDPYDKLHGWYNTNLSVWLEKPDDDLKIELYVKNLLDATPITDAFLNSDDTGLTTNIFTLDPRLIGLSIRKGF